MKMRWPGRIGRAAQQRLLSLALLSVFCLPLLPQLPAMADDAAGTETSDAEALVSKLSDERDEKQVELDKLQQNITLSSGRISQLQAEIDKFAGDNASLKQALVDSAARRRALEEKIGDSEQKIADLTTKEDALHQSLNAERDVLADVLAALQRMGRDPPPALLVSPGDALASVRSAILLNGVVPELRDKLDGVLADLKALQSVKTELVSERDGLAQSLDAIAEEEKRMDLLMAENDRSRQQSADTLAAEQSQAEALAAKATDLNSLIASLETEISSARNASKLAAEEAARQSSMTEAQKNAARERALSIPPDKNRITPAYPFSDLKDRLILPVDGKILRSYGDPDGTGHNATGITVETRPGALVTAPADGTVVYAGRFRSYGEMVILNVGDGYHIVMTGMDGLKVRQGDFIFSGEPLAAMGATRVASAATLALETEKPTLYIEFRHDGKPVDSQSWWAEDKNGKARNDT
ncbi:murein hydrolase activator EnvC family protein [Martelella alba]|nr:murein hydrolase activator EnvC [Martelella alba]